MTHPDAPRMLRRGVAFVATTASVVFSAPDSPTARAISSAPSAEGSRPTRAGSVALAAGAFTAPAMPMANTNPTSASFEGWAPAATNARPTENPVWSTAAVIMVFLRSNVSAMTPL